MSFILLCPCKKVERLIKRMRNAKKIAYAKIYKAYKRLIWLPCTENSLETDNGTTTDVIYYNQKLAMECNGSKIAELATTILKNEFSDKIKDIAFYELLIYVLTNRLCTMQSIKNVLSYKKEKNIKEIKDVRFNNGEVQLTCLI